MIAIYYIATSVYTEFFDGFLHSVERWMPGEDKCIVLLADESLAKYDGLSFDGVNVEYHHISHFPWPTIALWKFWLMGQHKKEGARLHFYFNANIEFAEECLSFDFSCFDCGKIVVTQHSEKDKMCVSNFQTGSICIPDELFDDVISEHNKRTCYYLQKDKKIPTWHDETVMNEILVRDRIFPFVFFDASCLRWQFSDTSHPADGLCHLRKSQKKENEKTLWKNALTPSKTL